MGEVFDDVGVESQDTKFVAAHNARQKLHDEDFVIQGESLVVAVQDIVELFSKSLRIVEKFQSREIGRRFRFVMFPLIDCKMQNKMPRRA